MQVGEGDGEGGKGEEKRVNRKTLVTAIYKMDNQPGPTV